MLTKQELLKRMHKLLWAEDDMMGQEDLFTLQSLVDKEIIAEHNAGRLTCTQLSNGFIKTISIP